VGALVGEVVFDEAVLPVSKSARHSELCALLYLAVLNVGAGYGGESTHPPQSHKFNIKFPMNLMLLCSTSIVAPNLRTSLAT
jgi:hypothetical protein